LNYFSSNYSELNAFLPKDVWSVAFSGAGEPLFGKKREFYYNLA